MWQQAPTCGYCMLWAGVLIQKTMKVITDLKEIDRTTKEGRLLFAALAKITTESQTDKTPYEVMEQLEELATAMDDDRPLMTNDRPLMTKNIDGDKCPKCGAVEVDAITPRTVYACGSSDYDQRPNTFNQSE